MTLQSTINSSSTNEFEYIGHNNENHHHQDPYDHGYEEEIDEIEDDLIENYRFLTQNCGVLHQSSTTDILNVVQQKQSNQQSILCYDSFRLESDDDNDEHTHKFPFNRQQYSPLNDLNNNNHNYPTTTTTTNTRIPSTIYYEDVDDNANDTHNSFSLIKLFARMKTRLKSDKRYRPKPVHELLPEEDLHEWEELTKNVRTILTKVLVTDPKKDKLSNRTSKVHGRKGSYKKALDVVSVLPKESDDEDKNHIEIDEPLNSEDDRQVDQMIWNQFVTCKRGSNYRRSGICKGVDRELYQGQLLYFYGVVNSILIDENLKASGLG